MSNPLRLIYLVTEDWFFLSHFLDRAIAAQNLGCTVAVVASENKSREKIESYGFEFFPSKLKRKSTNPFNELLFLWQIVRYYKFLKPDIVHHVGAKPIFYGTLAALITGVRHIVNAPIGLGFIFSSNALLAKLFKPILKLAYQLLTNPKNSLVIFENKADLQLFVQWKAVREKDAHLIPGAGVDLQALKPCKKSNLKPLVVLTARMLRDKGVLEFVAAIRILQAKGVQARFALVGSPDLNNPTTISELAIKHWVKDEVVEYWGWRDDMAYVLSQADIVCLPSYREGLPKSLIEACACGLPIVTTDSTGCNEVVTHGVNGYLVPVQSIEPLADALQKLILDNELRCQMGLAGRDLAERKFDTNIIIASTLRIYEKFAETQEGLNMANSKKI